MAGLALRYFGKIIAVALCVLVLPVAAQADIKVTVISEADLTFELSPSNFQNSPANFENSASNVQNSSSNFQNSPANFENSPSNDKNNMSGRNNILDQNGNRIGYYVFSRSGVLNFYNEKGRVFYIPSGGNTQSVFQSEGSVWCGTISQSGGQPVLGLTRSCLLRLSLDR